MADGKTAGQYIAERYFLDDEEAVALAKDIDSAIVNAINIENEACEQEANRVALSYKTGGFNCGPNNSANVAANKIVQQIRNRRKP